MKRALYLVARGHKETRTPWQNHTTRQIAVRLVEDDFNKVRERAQELGLSFNGMIQKIVREAVGKP